MVAEEIQNKKLFPKDNPTLEEIMQKIEVAHRVGKRKAGPNKGSRHIIAKFYSRPLRNEIVRRSKYKKRSTGVTSELVDDALNQERQASKIRFVDDLPQEDYDLKIKSREQMELAYKSDKKVRFWRGKLIIDGEIVPIMTK